MSNKASFQWVCRSANPFAREVVAGIAPDDIPGGSLPGVAEINAVALSKCMRTIDAWFAVLSRAATTVRMIGELSAGL